MSAEYATVLVTNGNGPYNRLLSQLAAGSTHFIVVWPVLKCVLLEWSLAHVTVCNCTSSRFD